MTCDERLETLNVSISSLTAVMKLIFRVVAGRFPTQAEIDEASGL